MFGDQFSGLTPKDSAFKLKPNQGVAVATFDRENDFGKTLHQPAVSEFGANALQMSEKPHGPEDKFVVALARHSRIISDDPVRALPAPIGRPKWVVANAVLKMNSGHHAFSRIELPRVEDGRGGEAAAWPIQYKV